MNEQGITQTTNPFPELARFRFRLRALDPIRLPDYAGSAWRGLLGRGLRRTVCVTRQPTCQGCLLVQSCVYSTLFETPPPQGLDLTGFTALPHPYVLEIDPRTPNAHQSGDTLTLGINLLGPAIMQAPYLIHALNMAGEHGIGREQGRFMVDRLERESTPGSEIWEQVYSATSGAYQQRETSAMAPPEAPDRIGLRIQTPLRIKHKSHFVTPREFMLAALLRHLYTRLQRLAMLYGGDPDSFDWGRTVPDLDGLETTQVQLTWHDWTRYSSRQQSLMQMGGLIGGLIIAGPGLARVWPALWAGQWTHVGKGTAFGLGGYRLQTAQPHAPDPAKPGE